MLIFIFLIPLLISLLLTPSAIELAFWIGAIDEPNHRKVHSKTMPRLGGLAIFSSFSISILAASIYYPSFQYLIKSHWIATLLTVSSFIMIFILGFSDDMNPLKPGIKFFVQWVCASLLFFAGFRILGKNVTFGFWGLKELVNYILTILWIVGITNAINLIDGLDGLAAGIGTISSVTIGIISLLNGDPVFFVTAIILAGSIFGFLKYNYRPAKIFLGDSGSLFIGFILSLLTLKNFTGSSTIFSIFVPLLIVGLPIIDTSVSMLRRFIKSYLPEELKKEQSNTFKEILHRIFLPDKSHIHHQLITRGLSHKNAVLTLYLVSLVYSTGAILITYFHSFQINIIISIFLLIFTFFGIRMLRYHEIAIFRNGMLIPILKRLFSTHSIINHFLDIILVGISYFGAQYLITGNITFINGSVFNSPTLLFTLTCGIQILVLSIAGLYKESIEKIGIGNILQIVKGVILAVVASIVFIDFIGNNNYILSFTFWILDFYLLLTLILGLRIAYPVLNYLFQKYRPGKKEKILIYGADKKGLLALHDILNNHSEKYTPVGFLDDNPDIEGFMADGYPIYGGHWKLQRLLKTQKISQILITSEFVKPIVLERIEAIAEKYKTNVQLFHIYKEDLSSPTIKFNNGTILNGNL